MTKQKLLKSCYSNKKVGGGQTDEQSSGNSRAGSRLNSLYMEGSRLKQSFTNISTILCFISPYILISFFVLLSIFNLNAKGIMYSIGAFILAGIVSSLSQLYIDDGSFKKCNLFGDILNDIPCYSTSLFSYTFIYLFMAMINSDIMNFAVIAVILCLGAADSAVRLHLKCTNSIGILIALVIGLAFGMIWYSFISTIGPNLLYFEEYVSNKVACSVPKKQDFKCQLYKNGELIDSF